jgi:hypothetical protein
MKKLFVLSLFLLLFIFLPSFACAAWAPQCTFTNTEVASLRGIECIISIVLNIATALAGLAFLIMLLANGFKLLGAWGNPKSVEEAQKGLTMAFLGLVILIAAWLIIRFLENFAFEGIEHPLTIFKLQISPPPEPPPVGPGI